jgi:hypothetical protein
VTSSRVASTDGLGFCSSGIRIVANPRLEPKVSSSRFFAPTAKHCGKASLIFDTEYGLDFRFETLFFNNFAPLLLRIR